MINDEIKTFLFDLKKKCVSCELCPNDLGCLIEAVRMNKKDIDDKSAIELLSIAYDVLSNEVELNVKIKKWCDQNGDYFAGNIIANANNCSRKFSEKYCEIFKSKRFKLSTITLMIKDIIDNYTDLVNDYCLRNPEVVLRDDVKWIDPKKIQRICSTASEKIDRVLMS